MDDCLFCKIIKGEIPSYKIYEDDLTYAFLDISNDANGHILVIPKKHCTNILDCEQDYLSACMDTIKKIGNHLVKKCGFSGINVLNASGKDAQQSIFHLHFHLLPRKTDDNMDAFPKLPKNEESMEEICEKLKIKEDKKAKTCKKVVLYTDGACSCNPGPGGWGAILMCNGKEKEITGGEENTTNNRMELMAVISGLEAIKTSCEVDLYSDSAYVINAFLLDWISKWQSNGWKTSKSEVLNQDLWKRLLKQVERHKVTWHKVKGHADNEFNNRCDALARGEIAKFQK